MKAFLFLVSGFMLMACLENGKGEDLIFNTSYPTDTATLFASDIISTHLNEYNITFSPDGNTILYTIANNTTANRFYTIFIMEKKQGNWRQPEIASFSGQFSDADPFFDSSGKGVYFISTRPVASGAAKSDFDIWYVDYADGRFGLARHLGNEVNSAKDELYPTVSDKGHLYFSSENGSNGYDLMVSRRVGNEFQQPLSLGGSINTKNTEFDAFVSPDESYIIYTGMNYEDSNGSGDLYISFNRGDYWTKGKNLGAKVNSVHMDQCPMVSASGKIMFFTSFRDSQPYGSERAMRTDEYLDILNSPLNGLGNIFWVDFTQLNSGD